MYPESTTKYCHGCTETKPLAAFSRSGTNPTTGKAYARSRCKACCNSAKRAWREAHPSPVKPLAVTKQCRSCGVVKPRTEFPPTSRKGKTHQRSECKSCYTTNRRAERDANPFRKAQIRAYQAGRRAAEPEKYRAEFRRWYAARGREYARKWKQRHPGYVAQQANVRRARIMCAYTEPFRRGDIIARDNGICYLCGCRPTGYDMTLDHVVPLARGGTHTPGNLRVACRSCNCRKRDRLLSEL
jgi:hypothetical protein